jgi:hypothetical protein
MRLGMTVSGTTRWLSLSVAGSSLQDLMGAAFTATSAGRDAWKGLIGSSASLQPNCGQEGINNAPWAEGSARIRIGIVGNQEGDCSSPDSWIGLGNGSGNYCNMPGDVYQGNVATCSPDNGDVAIKAFAYVLVR